MRSTFGVWVLGLATACIGCGRLSYDSHETADAGGTDAGGTDAGGTDAGGGDPDAGDAGEILGDCLPGETLVPIAASVPSVWAPANTCNADAALALDGVVAGLDRVDDGGCNLEYWPGDSPCGCVQVDLGAAYPVDQLSIRAAPVAAACGNTCDPGSCDTGHTVGVSWGRTEADLWTHYEPLGLDFSSLTDYTQDVGERVRFLVACRLAWGEPRDDVAVDAISAVCL